MHGISEFSLPASLCLSASLPLSSSTAAPDRVALRRLMRHVVAHPDEARAKGVRARHDMVTNVCPACIVAHITNRLRAIKAKLLAQGKKLTYFAQPQPGPRHLWKDEL